MPLLDESFVNPLTPSHESRKHKKSGVIRRAQRFQPLIEPDDAQKMKVEMMNHMVDSMYKRKKASLAGDPKGLDISEGFRLDNEFIISQVLECIPTNDPRLDVAMAVDKFGNRGLPRGKALEISGPEESMKSAQAYAMLAAAQKDPRGAIIKIYETEGKANARYIGAAGCSLDDILVMFPEYVEQIYWDLSQELALYIKRRNKHIAEYIKEHYGKKSLTNDELDLLMFRGRMSYPIFMALIDSYGNSQSMEAFKKDKDGKTTKTPGKHAAAHADGFRSITTPMINAMGVLIGINHTKDVFATGPSMWGAKKTTTYGGMQIKYMSSFRMEQRPGVAPGKGGSGSMLTVTRDGEKIVVGKWLITKILKNSMIESSHTTVEHRLFRYKFGVGFDMGVSYTLMMQAINKTKGAVSLSPTNKNKIILPNGNTIEVTYREFHDMLVKENKLREQLRTLYVEHSNDNAVLFRQDV